MTNFVHEPNNRIPDGIESHMSRTSRYSVTLLRADAWVKTRLGDTEGRAKLEKKSPQGQLVPSDF